VDVSSMIVGLYSDGPEVVGPARRESRGLWADQDGAVAQVGEGFKPRDMTTTTASIGLLDYGTAIRTAALRSASPFAARVGVFHVDDEFAALEFRPSLDPGTAAALLTHRGRK